MNNAIVELLRELDSSDEVFVFHGTVINIVDQSVNLVFNSSDDRFKMTFFDVHMDCEDDGICYTVEDTMLYMDIDSEEPNSSMHYGVVGGDVLPVYLCDEIRAFMLIQRDKPKKVSSFFLPTVEITYNLSVASSKDS